MGRFKGAGPRINREFPKAIPLWCASHQLNRVIVQSCTEPPIRKHDRNSRQCKYNMIYYIYVKSSIDT